MRLTDLTPGAHFKLEGGDYEVQYISPSGRIVIAYVLGAKKTRPGIYPAAFRQPDPKDLTGDEFLTTAFSDLRFNREHETEEDRELDLLL